jgi:transcriptional regulator with XRE-family HTH domain
VDDDGGVGKKASDEPSILVRMLGSMLKTTREICELSYDEAAQRAECEVDWLIRVETGFATASPAQVERLLERYGVRTARSADSMIDLARRVADSPPWLARHLDHLRPQNRDVIVAEAESTLVRTYGVQLMPDLAQCEAYFRWTYPHIEPDRDVDEAWHLLSNRQNHRPAGVTRLLDIIVYEQALSVRGDSPAFMIAQLEHLLVLSETDHTTVRVVPLDTAFSENLAYPFDILSFAGTDDRISVSHFPVLGMEFSHSDLYDIWQRISTTNAATPEDSRNLLQRTLHAISGTG